MHHALQRGSWQRLWLTSLLIAIVLTAFGDTQPGKHNAPLWDWIIFTPLIVVIRLGYRFARRKLARTSREG